MILPCPAVEVIIDIKETGKLYAVLFSLFFGIMNLFENLDILFFLYTAFLSKSNPCVEDRTCPHYGVTTQFPGDRRDFSNTSSR